MQLLCETVEMLWVTDLSQVQFIENMTLIKTTLSRTSMLSGSKLRTHAYLSKTPLPQEFDEFEVPEVEAPGWFTGNDLALGH